ncbi:hypothetical protein [Cyclobacterium marinum]|uniref:Uncharacterized protein n=1 Tax=Cyclobacterium marinum (strain ATCC 25205 / DSM 745 / LMG 13164 / NCIMB 1802) TaxID=880070 RepID=G0IY27_CYCMS|nr:hypothetical protein [Cyclobacterium marinum]AEL24360.1 hypothetical protein Cycma_0585 [Cyclobacterium marinum DSM 745]
MAKIFLDKVIEGDFWTGYRLYDIYFNDTTKMVTAEFYGAYAIGTPSGVTHTFGDIIYDECIGADKYQVVKTQLNPFGEVVIQRNASECRVTNRSSALYRFDDSGGDKMGNVAGDVCAFEGSAYVYWYGDLEIGSTLYENTSDDLLPYDGAGWFRIGKTAYQINASSEVITINIDQCNSPAPLPDPDPLPAPGREAYFHLPVATAVTFRKEGKTLFSNERHPGIIDREFYQVVKKDNAVTVQFGSSFTGNQVRVIDMEGGADVIISPTKVESNINQLLSVPGFAVNDVEIVGLQVWFPNRAFPEFGKVGNTINLVSDQISQQVQVTNVQNGLGEARGYKAMIVNYLVPITGTIEVEVSGKYNVKPYDVYEAVLPMSANGMFQFKIEVSDDDFTDTFALSEPVEVTEDLSDYQQVSYTNDNDEFGCFYGNGIIHERWIKSRLYQSFPGGEKTVNRETDAKLIKLDEYVTNSLDWEIFQVPPYLLTQLGIALGHDTFNINGVAMQSEESLEPEYFLPDPLANAAIRLEEVDFTANNRDASQAVDSADSFLKLDNDDKLKINP